MGTKLSIVLALSNLNDEKLPYKSNVPAKQVTEMQLSDFANNITLKSL